MPDGDDDIFSIRDIIDSQLETRDGVRIGRVSDIEVLWRDDGTPVLNALLVGPQALAGRLSPSLQSVVRFFLRNRFDNHIALSDVEKFGPTLRLRKSASAYRVGQSDRWIADHVLRWIPGSRH